MIRMGTERKGSTMGYEEEFLPVKQFDDLYYACINAGKCYEAGENEKGYPFVSDAFRAMRDYILYGVEKAEVRDISQSSVLSDLSQRNYQLFCSNQIDSSIDITSDNPYIALQEEVGKFYRYYARGISSATLEKFENSLSGIGGGESGRPQRGALDFVYGIGLIGMFFLAGLVFLLIFIFGENKQYFFVGAVLAYVFAIIFLLAWLNSKKDK